jgi:hypothetical protein
VGQPLPTGELQKYEFMMNTCSEQGESQVSGQGHQTRATDELTAFPQLGH